MLRSSSLLRSQIVSYTVGFHSYRFSFQQSQRTYRARQAGFIITNNRMETSVPVVFVVGDIRVQPVRQITNAVGDGTIAAVMAEKYLEKRNLLKGDQ